jgi:hypothetical protein
VGPESVLAAAARGVPLTARSFGRLDGVTGGVVAGAVVGVRDALGDALGEGLAEVLGSLGVLAGAAVVALADDKAVADAKADDDGVPVATGWDFSPHPHQSNEAMFQPFGPTPLACAAMGMPTAPTVSTAAMAPALFRRFGFCRCLGMRDPIQVDRYSTANVIAKRCRLPQPVDEPGHYVELPGRRAMKALAAAGFTLRDGPVDASGSLHIPFGTRTHA